MIENGIVELYGQFFELPKNKIETNAIRSVFQRMASDWYKEINSDFYKIFSSLDGLYKNADDFANRIRLKSIDEGMKFLAANGVYDIAELQFYEQFMSDYDTWDEEFDVIASQYEAIVEKADELHAHRKARRQNRKQWVGYTPEGEGRAFSKNITSNIGHGAFNLVAAGITAIGNSIKKDEIFKNPATLKKIANGIYNIVIAAFNATVDAVNSGNNNLLYNYSAEEISKAGAIIENINKGRIPKDNILSSLIKAIELYPYDKNIYSLLLRNFGGDELRLDETVAYFGLASLSSEKKQIFDARRSSVDLASLDGCRSNLPELKRYAKYICFDDFNDESEKLLKAAIKREFEKKLNLTALKSASDCKANIPILIDFANEIGYQGFEEESIAILNRAIDSDFKLEASKYPFKYIEDCDTHLPNLESYAKEIGYTKFEEWSNQIRSAVKPNTAIKAGKPEAEKSVTRSSGKPIVAVVIVVMAFLIWIINGATLSNLFVSAILVAILFFFIGLISPKSVLWGHEKTRGLSVRVYGGLILAFIFSGVFFFEPKNSNNDGQVELAPAQEQEIVVAPDLKEEVYTPPNEEVLSKIEENVDGITPSSTVTEINLLETPERTEEGLHINTDKGIFHMYAVNVLEEVGNAFANAKKGQCLALETEKDFDFSDASGIKRVKPCG